MKKRLPIGVSDFRKLIENDCYYVDKSLLIKDLLDDGCEVVLLPRPRRFGKTLNLSMLRYFFEKSDEDTSHLFRDLAIWRQGPAYLSRQGAHPVIYLTFKDVKCVTWDDCRRQLQGVISEAYLQHRHVMETDGFDPYEKRIYREIIEGTGNRSTYELSLKRLSTYLERHHGRKTIILIDEYDTPIHGGYTNGYYSDVVGFFRNLLGGALKDNPSLEKGVLTGILRVAKESIFSGLNNLKVYSLLERGYSTYFGLLEREVEELLSFYGIEAHIDEVRNWYNGYDFGGTLIYNPWSILNYVDGWQSGPQPYWVHTSDNASIRRIVTRSGGDVKTALERLLEGGSVRTAINDQLVFGEIENQPEAIWSFLLLSGYLTTRAKTLSEGVIYGELAIPNIEVETAYRQIVLEWFRSPGERYDEMLRALLEGDVENFSEAFQRIVRETFSYFDTSGEHPENVYHAFVLGLLVRLRDAYEVKSNRESGFSRYDVMLIPRDTEARGIVIEFKTARGGETLDQAADAALRRIEVKQYLNELDVRGVRHVVQLGIAFHGKEVCVKARRQPPG